MGAVVKFQEAVEQRPRLLEVFFVRSYWRDRGKLTDGKFEQFASMELALRAGKKASIKAAGVRVCRVRGNVSADYWEAPVQIARWGDVPPL